jgi:hypothetical protein
MQQNPYEAPQETGSFATAVAGFLVLTVVLDLVFYATKFFST